MSKGIVGVIAVLGTPNQQGETLFIPSDGALRAKTVPFDLKIQAHVLRNAWADMAGKPPSTEEAWTRCGEITHVWQQGRMVMCQGVLDVGTVGDVARLLIDTRVQRGLVLETDSFETREVDGMTHHTEWMITGARLNTLEEQPWPETSVRLIA